MSSGKNAQYIRWFEDLGNDDVPMVGGKNASLGEMIGRMKEESIRIPDGFATTAEAYWEYVDHNDLREKIKSLLDEMDKGNKSLEEVGRKIRRMFRKGEFPENIEKEISAAYGELSDRYDTSEVDVAVRSSATAEDLPTASFAGQQETFLNVTGEHELIDACRKCYASLFTDRAISYRIDKGFDHMKVALSAGVQKMVRSDLAGSGVMFSIDTETGFPKVVVINASWGLGENVVQGSVNPDEYVVFKPLLDDSKYMPVVEKNIGDKEKKMVYTTGGTKTTKNVHTSRSERRSYVLNDKEIVQLAKWAVAIEKHYEKPMDMEWAKDGRSGELYIVQARPETVQSHKEADVLQTYSLKEKGERLIEGLAIGDAIASGKAQVVKSVDDIDQFRDDSILVTGMTDPDWVPIMSKALGIVTDHGGRTSHAAIVSRELGVPAVVGTGHATEILKDDQEVTLSCAEGDQGYIYEGILEYEKREVDLEGIPDTRTEIMINIASPDAVFRWWRLPNRGIGLARMEFIINNIIKIHPMALVNFDNLEDEKAKKEIEELTRGYDDKTEYFVDHLSRGISKIAASQYPDPVVVRMSDFKTNEYANLVDGKEFEPDEDNPMLGFRGASRYYSDRYRDGFALECRAIKRVRNEMGFTNVIVMIPFCRTVEEGDRVLEVMERNDIRRGENGLEIYIMAEIPSNIILAEDFAERFDGFSIGSNDLTQLVLGVDRDSEELSEIFDERNKAVEEMIRMLIESAKKTGTKVGICGQGPSDYPDFAEFLVRTGINSISLNPDSVVSTKKHIAEIESQMGATVTSK